MNSPPTRCLAVASCFWRFCWARLVPGQNSAHEVLEEFHIQFEVKSLKPDENSSPAAAKTLIRIKTWIKANSELNHFLSIMTTWLPYWGLWKGGGGGSVHALHVRESRWARAHQQLQADRGGRAWFRWLDEAARWRRAEQRGPLRSADRTVAVSKKPEAELGRYCSVSFYSPTPDWD